MKMILAATVAVAAMTSVALAEAPRTTTTQPAGPVMLTDLQLDHLTAGRNVQRDTTQRCDFGIACTQNNQQNQSGSNRGGDANGFLCGTFGCNFFD